MAAAAVIIAGLVAACGQSSPARAAAPMGCPSGPQVTARGHGRSEGPPDLLTVSLGVETQAAAATTALTKNATKAQALVARLKADGVEARDLQTSWASVEPIYGPVAPNSPPPVTGYRFISQVTARVRNLANAGTLVDDAVQVAADAVRVNGLSFSIENDGDLANQARASAVHQAAGEAQAMATAAGKKLGTLCSISDTVDTGGGPVGFAPSGGAAASGGALGSATGVGPLPPIEAGSQQVNANVTMIYQLN